MRTVLAMLLTAALTVNVLVAAAAPRPAVNVRQRLVELNGYVRAETGYKSTALPKIVYRTNHQLAAMLHTTPCDPKDATVPCVLAAHSNGVVFLMDRFTFGRDDDILVHELTHFQQFESGKKMPRCEAEAEAYRTQQAFITEAGISGNMPGKLLLFMLTSCADYGG